MAVETKIFGKYPDGSDIMLYTLTNKKGMQAAFTNLGAALVKLIVPDKNGKTADVVLGYDRGEDYLSNGCFFGVVVGPSANRISNAEFEIDGTVCKVDQNDGKNNLHSHFDRGFHKRLWNVEKTDDSVTFSLEDGDGNLGFPGNKKISVTYTLGEDNSLKLHYHGVSDRKTILNPTNHTYFNLDGHDSGLILGHELWLGASNYTPAGMGCIPTGEVTEVSGTPMDFTTAKEIGRDIGADTEQLRIGNGFDHNWVIDGWDGTLRHFATVKSPVSGRTMKAFTTLPGVQFYAGNSITPHSGKGGAAYVARAGLCLETQYFPDSINKPQFPSCIFGEGREYDSVTVYQFE